MRVSLTEFEVRLMRFEKKIIFFTFYLKKNLFNFPVSFNEHFSIGKQGKRPHFHSFLPFPFGRSLTWLPQPMTDLWAFTLVSRFVQPVALPDTTLSISLGLGPAPAMPPTVTSSI